MRFFKNKFDSTMALTSMPEHFPSASSTTREASSCTMNSPAEFSGAFYGQACSAPLLTRESAIELPVECPWSHDTAATKVVPETARSNQKPIEW